MDGFEVVLNLRKSLVRDAQLECHGCHEQQNATEEQKTFLGLKIIHLAAPCLSRSRSRFVTDHHRILHLLEQFSHGSRGV